MAAQSSQSNYLEAKRQYGLQNYKAAKQTFQTLTSDVAFGAYASFYFALCAHQLGQNNEAVDMWKQLKVKHPKWDQLPEVDYWLTKVSFRQKKYLTAFKYAAELSEPFQNQLVDDALSPLSLEELKTLYSRYPKNKHIASYLGKAIVALPYAERDHDLLSELAREFGLDVRSDAEKLPIIKKDKYAVAVVLPFMFESTKNPNTVIRNSIVLHLYEGMKVAQRHLKEEGIAIELFPFDTRKSAQVTKQLIDRRQLVRSDVIIGPLYSDPTKVIHDFSRENKITVINPLSSNSEVIKENPMAYLFKPSYETQGRAAAAFASSKFSDNRKVCIFYETSRDSLVASAYRNAIEKSGFFVVRFEKLTNEDAQQIQLDFTEQYEMRLDDKYSKEQIDSIALIPRRYVKKRVLRGETSREVIKNEEGEPVMEYYENRFKVPEDSVGHFFVASASNLLANNFISLAEVRNDTIGLVGYADWLEFSTMSYDQLERLNVSFLAPNYFNTATSEYDSLTSDFTRTYGREPSTYHLTGYECMMQMGRAMHENGKYPQLGFDATFFEGVVAEGLQYNFYRDNQVVPITTLRNLQLINQTSSRPISNED